MLIQGDSYEELPKIKSGSVDLILIDPPYLISKSSNFKTHSPGQSDKMVTKYNFSIDFGQWDKEELNLEFLFAEFYRILRKGGTLITFYDIWKAGELKTLANETGFKQSRVCAWVKSNPVPVNSKLNYLSNATEYFFTFVKGGKPTFHSEYDKGFYHYPICHGRERTAHPTQKPEVLISELIKKHSNPGDLILDCFAGSGTTGVSAQKIGRKFILMEKEEEYFQIAKKRLSETSTKLES
jgi:site-specific DNA-methyltransferase (adenine-specific)